MGLKVVDLVKSIVAGVVSEGDTVVDATVGNGNDTIFLARLVGEKFGHAVPSKTRRVF